MKDAAAERNGHEIPDESLERARLERIAAARTPEELERALRGKPRGRRWAALLRAGAAVLAVALWATVSVLQVLSDEPPPSAAAPLPPAPWNPALFVVRTDDGMVRKVGGEGPPWAFQGDWSPNGDAIVYGDGDGLKRARADGSAARRLAIIGAHPRPGNPSAPAWARGRVLAYARYGDIWIGDPADRRAAFEVAETSPDERDPAFSPDGRHLAYVAGSDLVVIDVVNRRPRTLVAGDVGPGGPTWSPDASKLAFASKREGTWDLHTVDVNDGTIERLTQDPASEIEPDWSPDGRSLAYATDRDLSGGNAGWNLYVLELRPGTSRRLAASPYDERHPAWSPDGAHVLFTRDPEPPGPKRRAPKGP